MLRKATIAALLVLVTLAAYRGLASSAFIVYDDNGYVYENEHVTNGLDTASIAWAFSTGAQANWHPVTWLSHMLDVSLFGLDARKHHLVSLLLHAANVVLLFFLLLRMTHATWRSAFVAALFALHPLHVESVAWIAERKDVLSTLLWLVTLVAWLGYLASRARSRYLLVVVFYALGLMSKPMLVTLPLTLMLLDYWPLTRTTGLPLWREKLPLLAMSAASCVITLATQSAAGAVQSLQRVTFAERAGNALWSYAAYLGKTLWPAALAVFYPYPEGLGLFTWRAAAAAFLLVVVTLVALRAAKTAPYLAVGWFWYLITLLPVIGLVQVGGQAMADRYTYVPLIGIFVAMAWGIGTLANSGRAARFAVTGFSSAVLAASFVVTRAQVAYWADDVPLFRHAIAVTSGNWLAHNNLGRALFARGSNDEAMAEYAEALKLAPGYANAHYNLGLALVRAGRRGEAIAEFEHSLRLEPRSAEAHNNLGGVLADSGRLDAAIEHYRLAMRFDPQNVEAPYNLGNALFAAERFEEAVVSYEQALTLRPGLAEAHNNLGNTLVRLGRTTEAIEQYERALRLAPEFAQARDNLRAVRAASSRTP